MFSILCKSIRLGLFLGRLEIVVNPMLSSFGWISDLFVSLIADWLNEFLHSVNNYEQNQIFTNCNNSIIEHFLQFVQYILC